MECRWGGAGLSRDWPVADWPVAGRSRDGRGPLPALCHGGVLCGRMMLLPGPKPNSYELLAGWRTARQAPASRSADPVGQAPAYRSAAGVGPEGSSLVFLFLFFLVVLGSSYSDSLLCALHPTHPSSVYTP